MPAKPDDTPETQETATALPLEAQLEGLLFAAGEPLSVTALASALGVSVADVERALDILADHYTSRGVRLHRLNGHVRLVTAPELAEKIRTLLKLEPANRLSTAALETLAIIAYTQPVTKPQLEMIRGVACDGVLQTLLARNLIREVGRAETPGHPVQYGLSFEFLEYFGLPSPDALPPVERLDVLPLSSRAPSPAHPASGEG
ncbi:MAG: SMC-Scp complex subunit ScpB [Anaerolineae bacterium]|nr:SMC-Scp complex subunit ScpB [Anaerolineae bacterium]